MLFILIVFLSAFLLFFLLKKRPIIKKILAGVGLVFALTLSLGFFIFLKASHDKPVLKIIVTGRESDIYLEWKTPSSQMQGALLPTKEVRLESAEGVPLATYFILGDLVAVRAKVIRFSPFLHFFGLDNFCQVETLYNGYKSAEGYKKYPIIAYPLASSFSRFLSKVWSLIFFENMKIPLIKSATLESNYFPLIDQKGSPIKGSYLLTINEGGLSSVAE